MHARLFITQGRPQGKSLLFRPGEYVIGRGQECHVRPASDWVSRQHCLLRVTAEAVFIRDLGSRNGTLVNGARVLGERCLADGDLLQIGPLVFQLTLELATDEVSRSSFDETCSHCLETGELRPLTNTDPTKELHAFVEDHSSTLASEKDKDRYALRRFL